MPDHTSEFLNQLRARLTGNWRQDAALLQAEVERRTHDRETIRAVAQLMQTVLPGDQRRLLVRALCQDPDYCEAVLDEADRLIAAGDPAQALRDLEPLQEAEEVFMSDTRTVYLAFDNELQLAYYRARHPGSAQVRIPAFPFNRFYRLYVQALARLGTLPSCLGVCHRALVRNPLFADILVLRAQVCRRLGDLEGAREALARALPMQYRAAGLAHYFREAAELLAAERDGDAAHAAPHASNHWLPTDAAATIAARLEAAGTPAPAAADTPAAWSRILRDSDVLWEQNLAWCDIADRVAETATAAADYSTAGLAWTVRRELTGDPDLADRIAHCRAQGGTWS